MATQKQIDELMRLFGEARPAQKENWQRPQASSESAGMLGVLICLYRSKGTVTAGMLSRMMQITTGRVSVLIRKMDEKGLIHRETGKEDARVTEISLTEKGRRIVEDVQRERNDQMAKLIDTVGMDRLKEYIEISKEVWSILTPLSPEL